MTTLLFVMFGGTIGFFIAALCKAAGRADRMMETLEAQEDIIADGSIPKLEKTPDLVQEGINLEKETLI